jgi:hypothetical protein
VFLLMLPDLLPEQDIPNGFQLGYHPVFIAGGSGFGASFGGFSGGHDATSV